MNENERKLPNQKQLPLEVKACVLASYCMLHEAQPKLAMDATVVVFQVPA